MKRFLLDTNVFIEAYRRYYAFDLIPAFWDLLIDKSANGALYTIDKVKTEILKMEDDLSSWFNKYPTECIINTSNDNIVDNYSQIINHVSKNSRYRDSSKSEFASGADGWLLAVAKAESMILVTQEVYIPDCRKKVPIPNVCREHDVEYVGTFEMMRRNGMIISWKSPESENTNSLFMK